MRKPIDNNTVITVCNEADPSRIRSFVLNQCIGAGASCYAYDAIDEEGIGFVIKECCPVGCDRMEDGTTVRWKDTKQSAAAKNQFRSSFEIQKQIQNISTLRNTSIQVLDGLYKANGTLYLITFKGNTETFDLCSDKNLQEIFITARSIARSIGEYHANGFLHLDIKPSNILIFPETRELIQLLDFNSIVKKNDLLNRETHISYTQGYAAPEQLQGKRCRISEQTDIYSLGAIVFERIFGRKATSSDGRTFSDWDLEGNQLFSGLGKTAVRLTKQFLRSTISVSQTSRYPNVPVMIKELDELIRETQPGKRHLNSTCPQSLNLFVGRKKELAEIHTALQEGNNKVFISGMGGIGKTELALEYAQENRDYYDTVIFGKFRGSIQDLFKDEKVISIENDDFPLTGIPSFRGLVNERTLIIIDNFDTEEDLDLQDLLSLDCKVLITTRVVYKDIFPSAYHMALMPLTRDEQVGLFVRTYDRHIEPDDMTEIYRIIDYLDGLTLAIPLLAKHCASGDASIKTLCSNLLAGGLNNASDHAVHHYKDAAISERPYEIIKQVFGIIHMTRAEQIVLGALISIDRIMPVGKEQLNAWLGNDFYDVINELIRNSIIRQDVSGHSITLSVHSLIKEVTENDQDINVPIWEDYFCRSYILFCDQIAEQFEKNGQSWVVDDVDTLLKLDEYKRIFDEIARECSRKKNNIRPLLLNTINEISKGSLLRAINFLNINNLNYEFYQRPSAYSDYWDDEEQKGRITKEEEKIFGLVKHVLLLAKTIMIPIGTQTSDYGEIIAFVDQAVQGIEEHGKEIDLSIMKCLFTPIIELSWLKTQDEYDGFEFYLAKIKELTEHFPRTFRFHKELSEPIRDALSKLSAFSGTIGETDFDGEEHESSDFDLYEVYEAESVWGGWQPRYGSFVDYQERKQKQEEYYERHFSWKIKDDEDFDYYEGDWNQIITAPSGILNEWDEEELRTLNEMGYSIKELSELDSDISGYGTSIIGKDEDEYDYLADDRYEDYEPDSIDDYFKEQTREWENNQGILNVTQVKKSIIFEYIWLTWILSERHIVGPAFSSDIGYDGGLLSGTNLLNRTEKVLKRMESVFTDIQFDDKLMEIRILLEGEQADNINHLLDDYVDYYCNHYLSLDLETIRATKIKYKTDMLTDLIESIEEIRNRKEAIEYTQYIIQKLQAYQEATKKTGEEVKQLLINREIKILAEKYLDRDEVKNLI